MRISDWSSDVCSSDLIIEAVRIILEAVEKHRRGRHLGLHPQHRLERLPHSARQPFVQQVERVKLAEAALLVRSKGIGRDLAVRSEEHTSELQSLMRISYAVFCLKKKNTTQLIPTYYQY